MNLYFVYYSMNGSNTCFLLGGHRFESKRVTCLSLTNKGEPHFKNTLLLLLLLILLYKLKSIKNIKFPSIS